MTQDPRRCFECGGRGSIIGNYGIRKKCPKCYGSGYQVKNHCKTCDGIGVERKEVKEQVFLPHGIRDGQKIKIHQMGHCSDVFSSQPGDLLLTVKVKDHEHFELKDKDILSEVPITLA